MVKTEPTLKFSVNNTPLQVPVIIVAAGNSTRMQGINKQFATIGNTPVIIRSLLAFENSDYISNIILVTRADDIFELQMLAKKYGISKLSDIVCGGNSRQESVAKGFARIKSDCKGLLIHDGARPLVDNAIIQNVVVALEKHSAVACAIKVKDTIKQIDDSGKVIKTVPRDDLVAVQTPQGVIASDYKNALEKLGDLSAFTDDCSIMEAAGYDVFTTQGSYKNIKITTPEDIALAEIYLKEEEQCE